MAHPFARICQKARIAPDSPGAYDADLLWARLGRYKQRRGLGREYVQQCIDRWRAEMAKPSTGPAYSLDLGRGTFRRIR